MAALTGARENSPIVVRAGSPDDAAAALDVFVASEAARLGGPVSEDVRDRVSSRLAGDDGRLFVAEQGDHVVGLAVAYDAKAEDGAGQVIPGWSHLSMVFVSPDAWGQGIGGLLLDHVLAETKRLGYSHVQLWTHENNTRAQRLYAGRNFTRQGRQKRDEVGALIALWERAL